MVACDLHSTINYIFYEYVCTSEYYKLVFPATIVHTWAFPKKLENVEIQRSFAHFALPYPEFSWRRRVCILLDSSRTGIASGLCH